MRLFIVFVITVIILLPIQACNSEQPELLNPKLDTALNRLIETRKRGEAEEFAESRCIELIDGKVKVAIAYKPGQLEDVVEAAKKVGAEIGSNNERENLLRAFVPIYRLTKLAESDSIYNIRLPVRPELQDM